MCGIFGLSVVVSSPDDLARARKLFEQLARLSESRGSEASGAAIVAGGEVRILKQPASVSALLRDASFRREMQALKIDNGQPTAIMLIGHARLVTNGRQQEAVNNAPIVGDSVVAVHNGIVVNADELRQANLPDFDDTGSDSRVLVALLEQLLLEHGELNATLTRLYGMIDGAASVALLSRNFSELVLATNTGSLYLANGQAGALAFASEEAILRAATTRAAGRGGPWTFEKILPGQAAIVTPGTPVMPMPLGGEWSHHPTDVPPRTVEHVKLTEPRRPAEFKSIATLPHNLEVPTRFLDFHAERKAHASQLQRCSRCVLPETMPFIHFDTNGVCNYCNEHDARPPLIRADLHALADQHRRTDGRPDCVVGISGGRDSTFALHYVQRELGLNPIGITYDWGMVTDLARRNLSRLCSRLGVEHVIVSADIERKRKNIKRNIAAWLKRPVLGTVPIFMAGDKQFYYYTERIRRQTSCNLAFMGAGNELERTDFKTGFCGVPGGASHGLLASISSAQKLKLAWYYAKQFGRNPAYLNPSLLDTAQAFVSTYVMRHDFIYLYHHVPWDEGHIMDVLEREYDWERASDTTNTWRIGDGTAAFYNYIYFAAVGFNELDTFRSNQIRAGQLDRDTALQRLEAESEPRFPSIRQYLDLIDLDFESTIDRINSAFAEWPAGT